MRWRVVLLSLLFSLFASVLSRLAFAQSAQVSSNDDSCLSKTLDSRVRCEQAGEEHRWYGWQPLLVDAASIAVLSGGAALAMRKDESHEPGGGGLLGLILVVGGIGGYAFGAPVVHFRHQQPLTAIGSGALRLGLPLVAFQVAKGAHASEDTQFALLLAGMGVAVAIDAALLSWEPVPKKERLSLAPSLAWDGARGGMVGVVGSF